MLVPYLIGFLAAFPAAWFAVATTRPLAPVVPLLAALAATIPLGVLAPSLHVMRGVLVAVVLLGWAAVRARRREAFVGAGRGSAAAATAAGPDGGAGVGPSPDSWCPTPACLTACCSAAGTTRLSSPTRRCAARAEDATTSGCSRRPASPTAVGCDSPSWTCTTERPGYRRSDSPGSDGYGTFKRVGPAVTALHPGTTAVVRVRFRPGYSSDWLPMLGELTSIDFDFNPGRTDVGDVRYNQATASALVLGGVDVRDEYRFESVVGDGRLHPARTRRASRPRSSDSRAVRSSTTTCSPSTAEELLPLERVLLLARYLRTHGTVRTDRELRPVARHARPPHAGIATDDRHRLPVQRPDGSRGFPARRGRTAGDRCRAGPRWSRRLRRPDLVGGAAVRGRHLAATRPRSLPGSRVLEEGAEPVPAPDPAEFVREQLDQASKGRDEEIRPPLRLPPSPVLAGRWPWCVVAATAALGLAVLLLVPLLKQLRRARRRRTSSWSGVYVNGWQEVLDAARDRGTPVPEGWSRAAQAAQLGVPPGSRPLGGHRRLRARSAAGGGRPRLLGRLPAACDAHVVAEAEWRRRWWSHLNPASLIAGWARGRRSAQQVAPRRSRCPGVSSPRVA